MVWLGTEEGTEVNRNWKSICMVGELGSLIHQLIPIMSGMYSLTCI